MDNLCDQANTSSCLVSVLSPSENSDPTNELQSTVKPCPIQTRNMDVSKIKNTTSNGKSTPASNGKLTPVSTVHGSQCSNITQSISDILTFYHSQELKVDIHSNYMLEQPELKPKYRETLIDWLFEIQIAFGFQLESLYLSILIIDRYLGLRIVKKKYLQLVGIAALRLACKYEEQLKLNSTDFCRMAANVYTTRQLTKAEGAILKALEYRLSFPTAHHFLTCFLQNYSWSKGLVGVAHYICESSLLQYRLLKFHPSKIAASAIYIARNTHGIAPWTCSLSKLTTYESADLQVCLKELRNCFGEPHPQKNVVDLKFESSTFGHASLKELKF